jgi:hypothetical protein
MLMILPLMSFRGVLTTAGNDTSTRVYRRVFCLLGLGAGRGDEWASPCPLDFVLAFMLTAPVGVG